MDPFYCSLTLHPPWGFPDGEGAGPRWAEEGVRPGSVYVGPDSHSQQTHQKAGGKAESGAEEAQEKEGCPQEASPLLPTSR